MAGKILSGLYAVAIGNPDTGELVPLPEVTNFIMPKSADGDATVYRLADMNASYTFTLTFSAEDWERLQWLLGIHWLWRRYRRTLN